MTYAHTVIEVEADSKQAAVDEALQANMPRICAQCSEWGNEQNLEISDEWDVDPELSIDESVEEISA
jgi:hypothetical protein